MSIEVTEGLDLLRRLAGEYTYEPRVRQIGRVASIGDGVATVSGLPRIKLDELLEFPSGVLGLVMNIGPEGIDCVLLGSEKGINAGDAVIRTEHRTEVPVGEELVGRVVDHLGRPLDGKGPINTSHERFIERPAPGVVKRQSVHEPLQTGLKVVDAAVPLGRGQREVILGDRQTGKTAIAIDTIINQRRSNVLCVYVSIGQEKSAVVRTIAALEENDAMGHTIVVVADSDDPPANQFIAAYAGCTIAEWFMDRGQHSLVVYDDLTKHAHAYRQLSLLLRRPPGREAFPGDIFYIHARLLERAAKLSDDLGGGSMTALPIIETRAGNISAYIPTNLISITDGQIYLDTDLYNLGFKPAVDVGLSVSRVGGEAQARSLKGAAKDIRLNLAQYEEVQRFVRFGAEVEESTRRQLVRGQRVRETLKQPQYQPVPLQHEVAIVYAATSGHLDDVPLDEVDAFEDQLVDYLIRERPDLWDRLAQEWNADLQDALDDAITEVKRKTGALE